MIRLDEAQDILQQQIFSPIGERIPLENGLERILATDILAAIDMPPFSKSAMDGFAIGEADSSDALYIVEVIPAGKIPEKKIAHGECAKIMTGAMLPLGAGRVVKKESVSESGGTIHIREREAKKNILERGEDFRAGQRVMTAGTRLRPAEVAFLASIGVAAIDVYIRPRVGIVITGSELVEPGRPLADGKIYNSNLHSLAAQLAAMGVLSGPHIQVSDDVAETEAAIRKASAASDMVILSGGVSEGDFDFVPEALRRCGVDLAFERVAVQPGKPTVFGRKGNILFFGLPGNPVSTFIIFEILIKPLLYRMMGHVFSPAIVAATLTQPVQRRDAGRTLFMPMQLQAGRVSPLPFHGSGHLHALTSANALLTVADGVMAIPAGETINVRLL